jgi:hypothetical protein
MTSKMARRVPSPVELVLVDSLLTMLSRRMLGALDLGLVLLMEPRADRYTAFVTEHVARPMRAAALVLQLAVAEWDAEPATTPFEAVVVDTEAFVGALTDLAAYRTLDEASLKAVAGRLKTSLGRLVDSFLDIAERYCFEPSLAGLLGPARREELRQAIEDLPTTLAAEKPGDDGWRQGLAHRE